MKSRTQLCLMMVFVAYAMVKNGDVFAHPEAAALVDEQHCMFCHTTEAPRLAPSFPQIAQHYRQVPGAGSALARKLSLEGPAHWGDIAMPVADRADPLSPQDAQTVAQWLLTQ